MKHKLSLISIAMATLVLVSMVAVASVNVNAANDNSPPVRAAGALVGAPIGSAPAVEKSSANALPYTALVGAPVSSAPANGVLPFVQASSALVGAPVGSAPAVCGQGADIHVFVKGSNGDLLWKHFDGASWSVWTSLGGYVTADPAAVYVGGLTDVFIRGGSGSIWSTYTTDGGASWTNWGEVGGQSLDSTGPAAYAFNDGSRIGVFVTGMNHELWHLWADSTGRHGWEPLDGYLTSSPAATSPAPGWIDVFGRGGSGNLWGRANGGGASWGSWDYLGGQIAPGTGPAACSWSSRADVFVIGMSGTLYHRWVVGNAWSGWEYFSGYLISSPAAASRSPGWIDVMARGGSGELWVTYTVDAGTSWSNWILFGGI